MEGKVYNQIKYEIKSKEYIQEHLDKLIVP